MARNRHGVVNLCQREASSAILKNSFVHFLRFRAMSKIFISHSSRDNGPAIAVAEWLQENGWDEYFLDLEPERGIAAGERWERALHQAATRCEAVLFLISRNWLASPWCLREMELAYKLNKHLFAVLIDDTPRAEVPKTIAPWQMANLHRGQDHTLIEVKLPNQQITQVTFSRSGLATLKTGLRRAQIDPVHFPWPPEGEPDRAPWRGLEPLESRDAGIFFGRDGQIIGALDKIRALREAAPPRLMAIIGASGAGKSSFLRAGLIPRLKRDDHNYLVLPVIRPEGGALKSLTASLGQMALELKLGLARHDIGKVVLQAAEGNPEGLNALLTRMAEAARPPITDGEAAPAPAIVLPIDQGEELFHSSGRAEGPAFLSLLAQLLRLDRPRIVALVTIRSDSYDLLQRARELEDIRHEAFSLPPLARGNYVDVIRRPLEILNRHLINSSRSLKFDPAIIERLTATLDEGAGRDALPLLAFTLARLYRDFHARGQITVADYDAMGGVGGSIDAAVDSALARAAKDRRAADGAAVEDMLRQIMIPRFAGIDPETGTARRRTAQYETLPSEALPLVDALIEERLLTRDNGTVEPAHEALLREWKALTQWLAEDREQLITLEGVRRAAADWQANGRHKDYLAHREGRLISAEGLAIRSDLWGGLADTDHTYLRACREAEDDENTRRKADLEAKEAAVRKERRAVRIGAAVALVLLLTAASLGWFAWDRTGKARQAEVDALALLALSRAESDPVGALKLVLGAWPENEGGPFPAPSIAFQAISLAITQTRPQIILRGAEEENLNFALSPSGKYLTTGDDSGTLRLWDTKSGTQIGDPIDAHESRIVSLAFSPDEEMIASGSEDGTFSLWDTMTHRKIGSLTRGHEDYISDISFTPDGGYLTGISAIGESHTLQFWDVATRAHLGRRSVRILNDIFDISISSDGKNMVSGGKYSGLTFWNLDDRSEVDTSPEGHDGWVIGVAHSHDGKKVASTGLDGTVRLWDTKARTQITEPMRGHQGQVNSVAFASDDTWIVSGGADGSLRFWETATGMPIREIKPGNNHFIWDLEISKNDQTIASGSSNEVILWNNISNNKFDNLPRRDGDLHGISALSPDGTLRLAGSSNGAIALWDTASNVKIGNTLQGHDGRVSALAFSPDGTLFVSGGDDGLLRIWDTTTGTQFGESMTGHDGGSISAVGFSMDGKRVFSSVWDGTAQLWETETQKQIGKPRGIDTGDGNVTYFPDGTKFATATRHADEQNFSIQIWDAETGEPLKTQPIYFDVSVYDIATSSNGKRVAISDESGQITIWNIESGTKIGTPMRASEDSSDFVSSVEFSLDGTRIVSRTSEGIIQLWDGETGAKIGESLDGYQGYTAAFFYGDSTRIVFDDADKTLQFWTSPYPPGNILQIACRYLPVIDGRPDTSTDGLTAGIVNMELSLPTDCDSYDPPLPPEYRQ